MNETTDTTGTTPATGTQLPMGSRLSILANDSVEVRVIDVPEWGVRVPIRGLMAGERDAWEKLTTGRLTDDDNKRLFKGVKLQPTHSRALLVHYGTLNSEDPTSGRMFPDPADILALARKQSAAVSRVAEAIIDLSAVSEDDISEMEKGFEDDPMNAPSTDSQRNSKSGTSKVGAGK